MKKLVSYLKLVAAYTRINWLSQTQKEYRGAFLSQFCAMILNNSTWLSFWLLFFQRFSIVQGLESKDVITIWAIASAGFGLASAFFYNLHNLASLILKGQLDTWLLYPRAVLPHLALGKMSATALGDLVFGILAYLLLVRPDGARMVLFILLSAAVALTFIGFNLIRGSLGFYLATAEVLAEQWFISMITFSTYPTSLFDGYARLILYTLIPAVFVAGYPVQALTTLDMAAAGYTLLGSCLFLTIGFFAFSLGLSRYQSGNLMELRG